MINKKSLFAKIIFFGLLFIPNRLFAQCNFKTSKYIDQINDPKYVEKIEIEIPNNRKYLINTLKAFTTNGGVIPNKLKKKYRANVKIIYPFGNCIHSTKIKQHGDLKDHITFKDQYPITSLGVKMNSGNILNATSFILFIPNTRNNLNEILGSLIYKNFNFLSPETFEVPVSINNVETVMLFQEKARKEMLERNKRRESVIFEGDESLLIMDGDRNMNFNYEDLLLSRVINKNWFLKNKSAQYITINSYKKLQDSYLSFANFLENNERKLGKFQPPIKNNQNIFDDFNFLTLSMNGHHALIPHNRKFFFNTIEDYFEPIYYDGNLFLTNNLQRDISKISQKFFKKDFVFKDKNKIKDPLFIKDLENQFSSRLIKYEKNQKVFFRKSIKQILKNINALEKIISKEKKFKNKKFSTSNDIEKYIKRSNKKNINQDFVRKVKFYEGDFLIDLISQGKIRISKRDMANIISKNQIGKNKIIFLSNDQIKKDKYKVFNMNLKGFKAKVISSKNIETKAIIEQKKFYINSDESRNWILIKDANIDGWTIFFNESKENKYETKNYPRFNKRGLTGCLNFYNTEFIDANINVNRSSCEDGLNIMNSYGSINKINIENVASDGLDLDFSNINFAEIDIKSAGNDCIDLSGGKYFIKSGYLTNCSDKGLSVGEKSKVIVDELIVESSNIGVSVKDYSNIDLNNLSTNNTFTCLEVKQKKQEFGGALAKINSTNCKSKFYNDPNSLIKFMSNDF